MKKTCLILGLCAAFGGAAYAQTQNEDEDVNQYGVKVNSYPLEAKASNEILVLQNKNKGYKFWMDNRVQFDGAYYFNLKNGMLDGAPSDPKSKPVMPGGVSMRRVRSAVKAQVDKDWYGEIDLNFSNGVFELEDAYVQFTGLKNFEFKAGNFKEDFSMEETTTSRYTTFMERAMVISCFAPGRHIGMQAQWQKFDWLRMSAGVSWQLVDLADTRTEVENKSKVGKGMGPNYTGKIVWMPWASEEFQGLHIGYNGSYRSSRKTDDEARGYESDYFSSRNTTSIARTKYLKTEFFGVKHDILHGFELAGYLDGFRANGEFLLNNTVMNKDYNFARTTYTDKTKTFYGYYVQASYLLFGGKQRYDVTQSEFTQPTRGQKWGDIELMVRYDYLTLNSVDVKDETEDIGIFGGSGSNIAFGIVYHVNNNVKMMVNYQISQNDKYATNNGAKGDKFCAIGKEADGTWTNKWRKAAGDVGMGFHAIQARIEIDF